MIEVRTVFENRGESFHVYEAEAVLRGILATSVDGVDRIVGKNWALEADTKVDDSQKFFPVIVHRWESA